MMQSALCKACWTHCWHRRRRTATRRRGNRTRRIEKTGRKWRPAVPRSSSSSDSRYIYSDL